MRENRLVDQVAVEIDRLTQLHVSPSRQACDTYLIVSSLILRILNTLRSVAVNHLSIYVETVIQ